MIFGLVQVLFQSFLTRGKHVLNTLRQQIADLYALGLWMRKMMFGDFLDDFALILRH